MKAKYLGHPALRDESPRTVAFAGVTFPRNHFVDVPDTISEKLEAKLRGNPAFEVSDEPLTDAEREAAAAASSAFPAATEGGAAEPDLGGLDKPALLLRLAELKEKHPETPIEYSDKMGVPKLRAVLEGALFLIGDED